MPPAPSSSVVTLWQKRLLAPVYRHHNTQDQAKRSLPLTYEQRYALCQIAADQIAQDLAGIVPKVTVSRLEEELARESHRPNFTVETLAALRERLDPAQQWRCSSVWTASPAATQFWHWYQWLTRSACQARSARAWASAPIRLHRRAA